MLWEGMEEIGAEVQKQLKKEVMSLGLTEGRSALLQMQWTQSVTYT